MTLHIALVLGASTGGIGAYVRDLAAGLVERGCRVSVAAPAETGERFGFTGVGATFRPVPITRYVNPARGATIVRALRSAVGAADVVHAHGVRAGALTGIALARRDTPSVVTLHNAILASGVRSRLLTGLEKLAVLRADMVLGASADLVEHARVLGARDPRYCPVPAPSLPPPTKERAQMRAELRVGSGAGGGEGAGEGADERVLVLAVGRLAPQKDYATLLHAARIWQHELHPTGSPTPAPRLVIVGSGPLREPLQAQIDALGLDATLLGHRADIADLLAAADLLAMSSAWEARSLAVQEAMRAGVPVVATAVGGTPELARDAAVLVPPGDPQALATAVTRLAQDPDERARLAAMGRERASQWPDAEQCLTQLSELYSTLAATSRKT
jgi:glycosyltransferase involved in cell wall biosynthesis